MACPAGLKHFLGYSFCDLWYDPDLPSLTPKVIDGHTDYYARYCQRVNGRPKIVRQVYLGKVEDLVVAAEQSHSPPQPMETEVAAFGDVAAVFDIAQRLDLVPLLDSILPAKRRQGLSGGQFLLAGLSRGLNRFSNSGASLCTRRHSVGWSADTPNSIGNSPTSRGEN